MGRGDNVVMQIVYSKKALKALSRMNVDVKRRIKVAVERLPDGDVRQLVDSDIATHRLRVGDWRILYYIENETIWIEKIAPRGEVYRRV